jgi:hypothetical protein
MPAPGSAILIPRERSTTPSATRMRAASELAAGASWASDSAVLQPSGRLKGAHTARSTFYTPRERGGEGTR